MAGALPSCPATEAMQKGQTQTREEAHAKGDMQSECIHQPDLPPSAGTPAAETHLCDKHDVAAVQRGAKELEYERGPAGQGFASTMPCLGAAHTGNSAAAEVAMLIPKGSI